MNKYIRFNTSFIRNNNLTKVRYVRIFTKDTGDKILISFEFLKRKEDNSLTLSRNKKSGSGFCSASSLFTHLKFNPRDMDKLYYTPRRANLGNSEFFIIEIDKSTIHKSK